MAERVLPGIGLTGFWDLGADNWKGGMDMNLWYSSVLIQARVMAVVAAEPGNPAQGDIYLLDAAHATHPNKLTVWDTGVWWHVAPSEGWLIYVLSTDRYLSFNGVNWVDLSAVVGVGLTVSAEAETAYTFDLADAGTYVRFSNAAAITVTVPPNATVAYPIGTQITLVQGAVGQVTVAAGAGVTINSPETLKLRAQYSTATLTKIATDAWDLVGDLELAP